MMKTRKVHFGENIKPDCKREIFKNPNIPICIKRNLNEIHTDFRPINKRIDPNPPQPSPLPPSPSVSKKDYTTEIITGSLGTIGAVGALGAGVIAGKSTPFTEPIASEIEMTPIESENIVGELTIDATTDVAEITPFEIAGEGTIAAESALEAGGAIAGGAVAGLIAGTVATVGALAIFTEGGLFNFDAQASSFQKGAYNTQEEVKQLQPPQMRYVDPPPMFASQSETIAFFQRQNQAQIDYQQALSAYNTAISSSTQAP